MVISYKFFLLILIISSLRDLFKNKNDYTSTNIKSLTGLPFRGKYW